MKKSNHSISMEIDVTPEKAWEIIGKVSGVNEWLGPITTCRLEGNKRFCGTEQGEFEEDILEVNNDKMELHYGIPKQHMIPVENILGKMKVSGNGKATIDWSWQFDVTDENEATAKEHLNAVGSMGITGIETLIKQSA